MFSCSRYTIYARFFSVNKRTNFHIVLPNLLYMEYGLLNNVNHCVSSGIY